jgi:hypothetical protein
VRTTVIDYKVLSDPGASWEEKTFEVAVAIVGILPGPGDWIQAGLKSGKEVLKGATKSSLEIGQQVHRAYKADMVDGVAKFKEFRFATGRRADFIDFKEGIIYELKPNNARGVRVGTQQLQLYLRDAQQQFPGVDWRTFLEIY